MGKDKKDKKHSKKKDKSSKKKKSKSSSKKHRSRHESDQDEKHLHVQEGHSSGSGSGSDSGGEDEWVEKPAVGGVSKDYVESSANRGVQHEPEMDVDMQPETASSQPEAPAPAPRLQRDSWLLRPPTPPRVEKEKSPEQVEPELSIAQKRELNPYFRNGGSGLPPEYMEKQDGEKEPEPEKPKRSYEFGDAGSSWRMMKLRKVYETAEFEGRNVEEVALERYGSLEDFRDAQEERRYLDSRSSSRSNRDRDRDRDRNRRGDRGDRGDHRDRGDRGDHRDRGDRSFNRDRPPRSSERDDATTSFRGAKGSFQKPGAGPAPPKPSQEPRKSSSFASIPPTSISSRLPSMTTIPQPSNTNPASSPETDDSTKPVLSVSELNKLQSKVMKAKLMNLPNARELEEEYEREKRRAAEAASKPKGATTTGRGGGEEDTVVLPMIDSRGHLQDLSVLGADAGAGERDVKGKKRKEADDTFDKHGNRQKYDSDDDKTDLASLVLAERASRGSGKTFDTEMAEQIMRDSAFKDSLDYMDDRADKLAKKRKVTDDRKKQIAVNDYVKFQQTQKKCLYCFKEPTGPSSSSSSGGSSLLPPDVPVVSVGNKVYLALPSTVQMVPGHCLIVPVQHALCTLECEDDVWDEIRNFMKCLISMFANEKESRGVVFMEQVVSFKKQRHTVVECIPVPIDQWEVVPGFFKEAILNADEEWSQHKKIIDTSRQGGIRRSMVKNLPYFHIWFDPNRGYGHVIEDEESWPSWFGKEILAGMMDIPPDKWRRPRTVNPNSKEGMERLQQFRKAFDPFDWTKML
ncbi:hypothetical protein HK102_002350 [Quaeritorhiza haematococci]|nr:hypothetical protein HK102_002350 [Quaeritorhiza haematococci]